MNSSTHIHTVWPEPSAKTGTTKTSEAVSIPVYAIRVPNRSPR